MKLVNLCKGKYSSPMEHLGKVQTLMTFQYTDWFLPGSEILMKQSLTGHYFILRVQPGHSSFRESILSQFFSCWTTDPHFTTSFRSQKLQVLSTEPFKATFLGWGFPVSISRIHTAYIGENSSIWGIPEYVWWFNGGFHGVAYAKRFVWLGWFQDSFHQDL